MSITIYARNSNHGYITPANTAPFQFPGGEWHLKIAEDETPWAVRMNGASMDDLALAGMVADWGKETNSPVTLVLPYLPAARADRGVPFGGRVYANLINALGFAQVIVFDPHSEVVPGLINNLTILDAATVIKHALFQNSTISYAGIICPDQGAVARTQLVADALGLPAIQARKHRDFETGKLSGFTADPVPDKDGIYLVVDDICDGGGTFMGLAEAVGLPKNQLHLWISHGVFSKRAPQLTEAYDRIITTDSHPGHTNPDVNATIVTLQPYLFGEVK